MTILPNPVPDIRLDYEPSNQEYTAITLPEPSVVLFRIIQNTILGINFFGSFIGNIGFFDPIDPAGASVVVNINPSDTISIRTLKAANITGVEVQDVTFGGPDYQISQIKVNGLNILDSPLIVNSDQFISGVLIDSSIFMPENSGITIISNAGLPPSPFLIRFTGSIA